jgi:hypothetical protein
MTKSTAASQDESVTLRVNRPIGAVLSVRVPRQLAIAVDEFARERSLSMSEVVRDALETYFARPALVATFGLYGSVSKGGLNLNAPTVPWFEPTRGGAQTQTGKYALLV